jgi:hypothetical protein
MLRLKLLEDYLMIMVEMGSSVRGWRANDLGFILVNRIGRDK